jgi:hypothetical protein
MKPDWDKLMTEFADHKSIGVYDVDCTTAGKPLCDSNDVKGFPSIKHGDPANLEDYSGGRDFAALQSFAQSLKPLCSPANMDLCDDAGKAEIEKVQAMSDDDITSTIAAGEKKSADAEATFKSELDKLQASYKTLMETKDAAVAEVKAEGLGMLKAVLAARKSAGKEEL